MSSVSSSIATSLKTWQNILSESETINLLKNLRFLFATTIPVDPEDDDTDDNGNYHRSNDNDEHNDYQRRFYTTKIKLKS